MYDIILCEGETDAILISYYLKNLMSFQYINSTPKKVPKLNNVNNQIQWYKGNRNQYLAICPIGGSDFCHAMNEIVHYNKSANDTEIFCKIALVMDHDDDSTENVIDLIGQNLCFKEPFKAGIWKSFIYNNSFKAEIKSEIVCILQPDDEYGALETFVLKMLSQNDLENENVVKQVKKFIADFSSKKYLKHRRDKTKAELSVSLSVICPSKTFTTINEFLSKIAWEKYNGFKQQFRLLEHFNEDICD